MPAVALHEAEAVVVVLPEPVTVVLPVPVLLPEPVVLPDPVVLPELELLLELLPELLLEVELEVPEVEDTEVPLLSLPPHPARHSVAPNSDTQKICLLHVFHGDFTFSKSTGPFKYR